MQRIDRLKLLKDLVEMTDARNYESMKDALVSLIAILIDDNSEQGETSVSRIEIPGNPPRK